MVQAIIFDVDGTLAETEELHRRAFNETFAAHRLGWHWDEALYARLLDIAGGKERIAHYLDQRGAGGTMSRDDIARLHAAKTARYTSLIDKGDIALRPGVMRLLNEARAEGVRLAIATTTSRANVDALLRATQAQGFFEVIAAGDEVPAKKPAPDIYLAALSRLGLPASACVAIEDTLNGVRSAAAAGLRCLVTVSAYGGKGPFPEAFGVVSHLGELDRPFEQLEGVGFEGAVIMLEHLRGR